MDRSRQLRIRFFIILHLRSPWTVSLFYAVQQKSMLNIEKYWVGGKVILLLLVYSTVENWHYFSINPITQTIHRYKTPVKVIKASANNRYRIQSQLERNWELFWRNSEENGFCTFEIQISVWLNFMNQGNLKLVAVFFNCMWCILYYR